MNSRFLAVLFILAFSSLGCSDGRPTPVKTSGQVFLNGEPLTFNGNGFIQVVPEDSRPATGKINPQDGTFTLTTFENQDGVVPGKHTVTVIALATGSGGASVNLLPEKYASTSTSELTIAVDEPTNSLRIELEGELRKAPNVSQQQSTAGDDPGH